jgi:hypothetical protein
VYFAPRVVCIINIISSRSFRCVILLKVYSYNPRNYTARVKKIVILTASLVG